ncbi:MAG TPA: DUF1638 domain-containing protein [Afifellaceae bacterium]|nr:DUF1638 domain-containing protein [Afifellaceae bacterium]
MNKQWTEDKAVETEVDGGRDAPAPDRVLIIACGALAREILATIEAGRLDHIDLTCLPALLHNRPEKIPEAVREAVRKGRDKGYRTIAVGYADCGTGGLLEKVCAEEGVEMMAGPHCYAFFSGTDAFLERGDADFDAFFLTDFLARQFETLIIKGLGIDRHPELKDIYFAHYRRLIFLEQKADPALEAKARAAAETLGLAFEKRVTGYGDLATFVQQMR